MYYSVWSYQEVLPSSSISPAMHPPCNFAIYHSVWSKNDMFTVIWPTNTNTNLRHLLPGLQHQVLTIHYVDLLQGEELHPAGQVAHVDRALDGGVGLVDLQRLLVQHQRLEGDHYFPPLDLRQTTEFKSCQRQPWSDFLEYHSIQLQKLMFVISTHARTRIADWLECWPPNWKAYRFDTRVAQLLFPRSTQLVGKGTWLQRGFPKVRQRGRGDGWSGSGHGWPRGVRCLTPHFLTTWKVSFVISHILLRF